MKRIYGFWLLIGMFLLQVPIAASDFLYQSLNRGWGIRPYSMGSAFTAIAEGGHAMFYNPAGLAVPGGEYRYENMDYQGTDYPTFFAHSLYISPFGFSYMKQQDMAQNSVEATCIGFGKNGRQGIDWGFNFKSIKETTLTDSVQGWSTDLGLLAHITPQINVGVSARDLLKQNIKLPASFTAGIAWFTLDRNFTLASDLVIDRSQEVPVLYGHYGAEWNLTDGFIVRSGWFNDYYTGGVSLVLPIVEVDYGILYPTKRSQDTIHMLGFRLGKGPQLPKRYNRYSLFKPKSFATFAIGGNLIEGQSEISLLGGMKIGSNDLLYLIHEANADSTCEGYMIKVGNLASDLASIGMIQEVRRELKKAKDSGKKVIVYLENWSTLPEYYLASIADQIIMPELGTISHLGLSMDVLKFKTFLNNFGMDSRVIASGKYKGTTYPSSTEKLDESERLLLTDLLNSMYHQVLFEIKESRNLKWQELSQVFDGRIVSAQDAKKKGLVDKLGYWDEVKLAALEEIKPTDAQKVRDYNAKHPDESKKEASIQMTPLEFFADVPEPASLLSPFNRIAVIEIDGMIMTGQSGTGFLFGGKTTGADDIEALIKQIEKDISIKGVVLRINSPGGSMLGSDRIYQAVCQLRKSGKLVYTSMGNLAASGGYYIALGSNKIMANTNTLTGSIGVISVIDNYEGFNKMLGLHHDVIKTGKYMDMMSSNRALTADETKMLQAHNDEQYQFFVQRVIDARKLTREEANAVAQGQVFTGEQAQKLKLVDDVGNFYDTVDALSKEIKVSDPELVFFRKEPHPLFSFLGYLGL